jgi:hypothetical protein
MDRGLATKFKRHSTSPRRIANMGAEWKPGIRVASIQPRALANHVLPCQTPGPWLEPGKPAHATV